MVDMPGSGPAAPGTRIWANRLEVIVRVFNADGSPRAKESVASVSPLDVYLEPSIAVLANGNLVLIWRNGNLD